MSEFSDYCKRLLEDNKMNVYQLSKISGMERTSLQRMVNGQRDPNEELQEVFLKYVRMTMNEKEKFCRLYQIKKLGRKTYENRLYIHELLCYMKDLQESACLIPEFQQALPQLTEMNLENSLRNVFEREAEIKSGKAVLTNLPIQCSCLWNILRQYQRILPVRHLFAFSKKENDMNFNENLETFRYIIPFALNANNLYQSYYCYTDEGFQMMKFQPYPYALVSSGVLLLISGNFQKYLWIEEADLVRAYREEFELILEKTTPLVTCINSQNSMFHKINELVMSGQPAVTYDCFPCFLKLYKREIFAPYLKEGYQNSDIIELLDLSSGIYNQYSDQCETYMPIYYLKKFMESGVLCGKFAYYINPLSMELRYKIIEDMYQRCADGTYRLHFIRTDLPGNFANLRPEIWISLFGSQEMLLMPMDESPDYIVSICPETGIIEAFTDYLKGLSEMEQVTGVEESMEILQEILKRRE